MFSTTAPASQPSTHSTQRAKCRIYDDIPFVELAKLCDFYETDLILILRLPMCYQHCFQKSRKGFLAHTATSRSMIERPGVKYVLGAVFNECYQSYD